MKRPWDHRITAVIPHKDTPELLTCCIRGLQWQDERPHIVVVDFSEKLPRDWFAAQFADEGIELINCRGLMFRHAMEGMTFGYDVGIDKCQTEFVYFTQPDVLLHRKNFLSWLSAICCRHRPVVGYETYDRSDFTEDWKGMVNNVATLCHSETIRRANIRWSFVDACGRLGKSLSPCSGWPDGETGFNLCCRSSYIVPYLIGREEARYDWRDDNLCHVRAATARMNGQAPLGYRDLVNELIAVHLAQYASHDKQ